MKFAGISFRPKPGDFFGNMDLSATYKGKEIKITASHEYGKGSNPRGRNYLFIIKDPKTNKLIYEGCIDVLNMQDAVHKALIISGLTDWTTLPPALQYVSQEKNLEDVQLYLVSIFAHIHADGSACHTTHRRRTSEAEIAGRLTQKAIVYDGSDHRIQDGKLLDPWQMSKP